MNNNTRPNTMDNANGEQKKKKKKQWQNLTSNLVFSLHATLLNVGKYAATRPRSSKCGFRNVIHASVYVFIIRVHADGIIEFFRFYNPSVVAYGMPFACRFVCAWKNSAEDWAHKISILAHRRSSTIPIHDHTISKKTLHMHCELNTIEINQMTSIEQCGPKNDKQIKKTNECFFVSISCAVLMYIIQDFLFHRAIKMSKRSV